MNPNAFTKSLFLLPCLVSLVCSGLPVTAAETTPQATDVKELTLRQAIEMALQHNLDIVVSRLSTTVQFENIAAAKGFYRPAIRFDYSTLDSRTPATNQLVGAAINTRTNAVYNAEWAQQLPTGGSYSLSFNNNRLSTNSQFSTFNPSFSSNLTANITQPLIRNLQLTGTKQQLVIAQNGERVSRHQFQAQVIDVIQRVANAYVDLSFALRDYEVSQKSLQLAKDLLNNNRIQVEVGTMAPIDVLQAEAEVAQREEAVIVAEALIRRAEDSLKMLINDPESPDFWGSSIRPIDPPQLDDSPIDWEAAVKSALSKRPELMQAQINLDTANFNIRYTKNQLRPQVDLFGAVSYSGLGGTQIIRNQALLGDTTRTIPGGYADALDQIASGAYRDWQVGITFDYPLGNSQADAANAKAQIEYRQQRAGLTNLELQIAQEVRDTARSVDTGRKRVDATRVSRELAAKRLEAEQKKFAVGMSTNFFVVQAQRDLSQAEANELRAMVDYYRAYVSFRRARGTLIEDVNVEVK